MNPGNPKGARKILSSLIKQQPSNIQYQSQLALSYLQDNNWSMAQSTAKAALADNRPEARIAYADLLLIHCYRVYTSQPCDSEYKEATEHFREALKVLPDNRVAQAGLSRALSMMREDLEEAKALAIATLAQVPFDPMSNYWVGHIMFQLGDQQGALPYLLKAANWSDQELLSAMARGDLTRIMKNYGVDEETED